jgi:hypothetical protein
MYRWREDGNELSFQVIAERYEKPALNLTVNSPLSEWTPRHFHRKALFDRDYALTFDPGVESSCFRRTLEKGNLQTARNHNQLDRGIRFSCYWVAENAVGF